MSPVIDHAEDPDPTEAEKKANQLVKYWQGVLRRMGAERVAGIGKSSSKGKRHWDIELEVQVPRDSQAYRDFMRRFAEYLK